MRNIHQATLDVLAINKGNKPLNIVEIQWANGERPHVYSDKKLDETEGKILEISNLDSIINVTKSGTSQSVSITLDDTDGSLKEIFNNTDIHKKPVLIYQYFEGMALSEKFLLFAGQISSPIVWKEADRTLSFDVVSKIEDVEVGFSPEAGAFGFLPQNLIGQPWPMVFGTVQKLPAILIDDIPYGGTKDGGITNAVTKEPIGIGDPSIEKQINIAAGANTDSLALANLYFILYLQASFSAVKAGEIGDLDDVALGNGTYSGLAQQYLDLGNQKLLEAQKVQGDKQGLQLMDIKHKSYEKSQIAILNGNLFPQGVELKLDIGGAKFTGSFTGEIFHITLAEHPDSDSLTGVEDPIPLNPSPLAGNLPGIDPGKTYIQRKRLFFADAGTPVSMVEIPGSENPNLPIRYIAAAVTPCFVNTVYAYRSINGAPKQLYPVPFSYFSVYPVAFGSIVTTMIYMSQPLSTRNEGWEDEIFTTLTSTIGPNTVSIIQFLIQTYTTYGMDTASFTSVGFALNPYPSHFAILDQPNIISLLQDIAFQARCIIWLDNGIFKIKYLATADAAIDTITESDILYPSSLEISCTETEDIVTKLIATWKPDYLSDEYKIVLRHNILKYGVQEQTYNFFIYNIYQLVEKSATFWLIRLANTYKRISFKTPISKLKIETLDTVTLDFDTPYVATTNVNGVVESANFNSEDFTIDFVVWVPVRFGEMRPYPFAYPGDLTIESIFPTPDDNPGAIGIAAEATFPETLPDGAPSSLGNAFTGSSGNGQGVKLTGNPYDWGSDPANTIDQGNTAPTIATQVDSVDIAPIGTPTGVSDYQYKLYNPQLKKPEPVLPAVFPGVVKTGSGQLYEVNVYFKGLDNEPTPVKDVKQLKIKDGETIPEGTYCFVSRISYSTVQDNMKVEYYMLVPIWL